MNERLEELKQSRIFKDAHGNPFYTADKEDYEWLISRMEELEYASKYNGELNEFLQKRKLPPNTLGRHVVDVVMEHVEELETKNNHAMTIANKRLAQILMLQNSVEELESDKGVLEIAIEHVHLPKIKRYKQALEFYEKWRNYQKPVIETNTSTFLGSSPIENDAGYKARQALAGEPNETQTMND